MDIEEQKNDPAMIRHLKACSYADNKTFVKGLESYHPIYDADIHKQWLRHYDSFIKGRTYN